MIDQRIAGILLRLARLERNWSQEILCSNICAVSYLSKIEQGKVDASEEIIQALFAKLDISWQTIPQESSMELCEQLYEYAFADQQTQLRYFLETTAGSKEITAYGIYYLDILVLRSYGTQTPTLIPKELHPLLDSRQQCLLYLSEGKPRHAMQIYPCALAAQYAGAYSYAEGNYPLALEYLQNGYHMACAEGYVHIMMYCQIYIANCYSDMRNISSMIAHYKIAQRLAKVLGEEKLCRDIDYNLHCTQMECGEYEGPYAFFSKIKLPSALELHKLAICCEKLGKTKEAMAALDLAAASADNIELKMCEIVRYRLLHPGYLKEGEYGEKLLSLYQTLKQQYQMGFARYHLPWVEEWCIANRQYRTIYEIMRDFL